MTKKEATDILIAVACCGEPCLSCEDCPFCIESYGDGPDVSSCGEHNSEAVVMAVKILRTEAIDA